MKIRSVRFHSNTLPQVGFRNISQSLTTGETELYDVSYKPGEQYIVITDKKTKDFSFIPLTSIVSIAFFPLEQQAKKV